MGESVAEATIIKWSKGVGDRITMDDTVMEIATDKVDSEVPSPVAGTLVKQLYNINDVVQVGSVIAVIETAEAGASASAPQAAAPAPQPEYKAPEPVKQAPTPQPVTQAAPEPVYTPPYVEQIQQPRAIKPLPPAGSRFYSPLVKNIAIQEKVSPQELDTIPGSGAEGRLTKEDLLAYVKERANRPPAPKPAPPRPQPPAQRPQSVQQQRPVTQNAPQPQAAPQPRPQPPVQQQTPVPQPAQVQAPAQQPPVQQARPVQQQAPPVQQPPAQQQYYQPPVQQQPPAQQYYQQAPPQPQYIQQAPVQQYMPPPQQQASRAVSLNPGDEIIEMDRMRRLIADHMVMSVHTSPHVTSFIEADVTNMVVWREKVKNQFEEREKTKITFTPLFIEAIARAIKDLPMINVSVNGTQIIKRKDINIGMATALPTGNLIVPVIRRADQLNLVGLTKAVNDLSSRARVNKLAPDEVKDGTFTVTNVGSFGNVMGTPIINQPQVAIMALGVIKKKPAVISTSEGDVIGIRHMMFLSLSYDHRVVDGSLGGSFLRKVADYMEQWDVNRGF
ncbi:dihydrolipoamide acetyltransferase family protein [Mucilaginibacter sp.]|uniref:dihydrolipoamide acetyltransferase family protein n=1 Tax=Mucilaginibacter sp. TaxID=1882438 RepID=UPI00326328F7